MVVWKADEAPVRSHKFKSLDNLRVSKSKAVEPKAKRPKRDK